MRIYHNPRCSKSREARQLCEDAGVELEIVEYLKTPPDEVELNELLCKLGLNAHGVIRSKEDVYSQLELSPDSNEEELLAAIIKYPILLERPIVVKGKQAVIGRPPENVKQLL
jgi:arsenate reductase